MEKNRKWGEKQNVKKKEEQKMKKIEEKLNHTRELSTNDRFLAKTLRVNKIAMKNFSKKISHSNSTVNCWSHHSCINLTHTM